MPMLVVDRLCQRQSKPLLYVARETQFWTDPHLVRQILDVHLYPNQGIG